MPETPDAVEIRVVGCLVEKQRTTPDVYPLSLNSLRIACNQSTNRDPVVDYDEETVVEALRRLALRGWTRLASGPGSRARKYRHLLDEALGVDGARDLAARGPDAARRADPRRAEAAQRAPALLRRPRRASTRPSTAWSSAAWSPGTPRRPGQKEERYEQLLGSAEADGTDRVAGAVRGAGAARRTTGPRPTIASSGSSASWPSSASSSRPCARNWGEGEARGSGGRAPGRVRPRLRLGRPRPRWAAGRIPVEGGDDLRRERKGHVADRQRRRAPVRQGLEGARAGCHQAPRHSPPRTGRPAADQMAGPGLRPGEASGRCGKGGDRWRKRPGRKALQPDRERVATGERDRRSTTNSATASSKEAGFTP